MLPSVRHEKLLALLEQRKVVTIPEFVEMFNISTETVRRDLNTLEKMGKLEKVYGGAKNKESSYGEPAMEARLLSKLKQKEAIGKRCSKMINNGECIYIDSGTTTFHIAKELKYNYDKKGVIIVTNSLPVVTELTGSNFEVLLLGGKIRHSELSIISQSYLFDHTKLNIHKAFICAGGLSLQNGISDFSLEEIETRRLIMSRSKEIFLAADSSKFEKDALINLTSFDDIQSIITDNELPIAVRERYQSAGVDLVIS